MARVRISTTVDEQLLATARRTRSGLADAALIDEALSALLAHHRTGEIGADYAAYDRVPLDADDEWGVGEPRLVPVGCRRVVTALAARREVAPTARLAHCQVQWAHLGSNQGPLACEASALPLSYAPGNEL
jgi:hypothetical protein